MKKMLMFLMLAQCGVVFAASETAEEKKANDPVKLSVSVGTIYTDNRDGFTTTGVKKESCFDLYITPRLALDLKWEDVSSLELSYAPTFRYRNNPNKEIGENKSQLLHDLAMKFSTKPTPNLELRARENFNYTDDPSVQQNGSTLRRDNSFILSETEIGAKALMSRLSNIDLVGRYLTKKYSDKVVGNYSDMNRTDAGVSFWHQPWRQAGFSGSLNYSKYGYEKFLGVDRGFDSMMYGAGVENVFSPEFRCGLHGGLQSVSYTDKSLKSDSSPYATLSAQFAPAPETRFTASIGRQIRESYIVDYASQKMTDFGLRMDWDSPAPEWALAATVSYRLGDYDAATVPAAYKASTDTTLGTATKTGGKDKALVVTGEVAYKLGLMTSVKLILSHEDVSSDVYYSFKRNAANLALIRTF